MRPELTAIIMEMITEKLRLKWPEEVFYRIFKHKNHRAVLECVTLTRLPQRLGERGGL